MVNKVILIGNVGADPEVRTLENGTKVARIRVATTERIFNRETQERRDHTEWHSVALWGRLADVADKYIHKGSQVYIEGKIRSREWEDPATHTKRYYIEIMADVMNMLGRRTDSGPATDHYGGGATTSPGYSSGSAQAVPPPSVPSQNPATPAVQPIDDPDDLPF
ncbi:MAG: single-stranded DNA-binding protein [Rikenellaceae bacterium]|jgi:single-strand DNA-binding protein|nr:single-stranded DNA-binding protein [Rikenellaceae bacterium]